MRVLVVAALKPVPVVWVGDTLTVMRGCSGTTVTGSDPIGAAT